MVDRTRSGEELGEETPVPGDGLRRHAAEVHVGRVKAGPAPALVRSANELELSYAPLLYEGMSLADMAHVIVLVEAGIVGPSGGRKLLEALLSTHELSLGDLRFDPELGDVYQNRERYLRQLVPEVAGWLRAGRARREVTNIGYRLAARSRLLALGEALETLVATMLTRAEEHVNTVMPDYTYLQQAQPTTFGHYLLGFVYPLFRDWERLRAAFSRINRCPGGIGSVNGSRLPLDRQRLADLLGFEGVIHHTRDAMWQADTPIELTSVAVALLVNLDRLAEDLQIWATQEFHLVELADEYSRTSVIMPQKKNPYSLAYVRGLANVTIGHLTAMANVGRTPSGQPDSRIFAYGEVPRTLERTREAVALMAGVVATLRVNADRMAERAGLGYTQATDLAEEIMLTCGVPYQSAHRLVGHLVAQAVEDGVPAEQITPEMVEGAGQRVLGYRLELPPDFLTKILDPLAIVATRRGIGGAAAEPMQAMLKECRASLSEMRGWRETTQERQMAAEEALLKAARNQGPLADGDQPECSGR